jgi:hypothetical protein
MHPIHRLFVLAAACLATSLQLAPAGAQAPIAEAPDLQTAPGQQTQPNPQRMACGNRSEVVRILRENFDEKPVAHGLANTGMLAEIFSSPRGTWTIVATSPNGMSCMIGAGDAWKTTLARDDSI